MKTLNIFSVFIIISICAAFTFAQTLYAPWAELKTNMPPGMKNSYENMKLNTPPKSEIEIPAYPGAKIIETSESTQSVDDSKDPYLPTITLVSNDPADKVIKIYKEIIADFPDWHWSDNLKLFYKGNLQESLNRHSPYIQVTEITTNEPGLIYVSPHVLELANSKIIVCYNPRNLKKND